MKARYLTEYPIDGYLRSRRSERLALRRDKFNLRPLIESLGWALAGATVGSIAVMLGAWGMIQLTEPRTWTPHSVTAKNFQAPTTFQR